MEIGELKYSACAWYKDGMHLTKRAFLDQPSEYFVFGDGKENSFRVFRWSAIADAFLRKDADILYPLNEAKSLECSVLRLGGDLLAPPHSDQKENIGPILNEKSQPVGILTDIWNLRRLGKLWKMPVPDRGIVCQG